MSDVFAGIDVGSTTTKVVILSGDRILAKEICATGASCRKTSRELYDKALGSARLAAKEVAFVVSTGYGRKRVDFSTEIVSEITANAVGARFLAGGNGTVRTVIDVGGQDSKAIALDDAGRVSDFAMNDKCAAGTGRFLEVMSHILEIDLDELGKIALTAVQPHEITSLCTVFAESEVIGLVSEGKRVPDIVAGIHEAIASRVGALVRRVGLRTPVFFDGGAALNPALRKALEKNLGVELIVPEEPQMVAATGAALIARERRA
jgi:predicted CoA-substrate-specific enzyme activase